MERARNGTQERLELGTLTTRVSACLPLKPGRYTKQHRIAAKGEVVALGPHRPVPRPSWRVAIA